MVSTDLRTVLLKIWRRILLLLTTVVLASFLYWEILVLMFWVKGHDGSGMRKSFVGTPLSEKLFLLEEKGIKYKNKRWVQSCLAVCLVLLASCHWVTQPKRLLGALMESTLISDSLRLIVDNPQKFLLPYYLKCLALPKSLSKVESHLRYSTYTFWWIALQPLRREDWAIFIPGS